MTFLGALLRHGSGRIGASVIAVFTVAAILGLIGLTPHDPLAQDRLARLQAPGATYWMGTDLFGRDILSRLMVGIGQSFAVALLSVGLATVVGTVLRLPPRTESSSRQQWQFD